MLKRIFSVTVNCEIYPQFILQLVTLVIWILIKSYDIIFFILTIVLFELMRIYYLC